jgi:hypothetical protein
VHLLTGAPVMAAVCRAGPGVPSHARGWSIGVPRPTPRVR